MCIISIIIENGVPVVTSQTQVIPQCHQKLSINEAYVMNFYEQEVMSLTQIRCTE